MKCVGETKGKGMINLKKVVPYALISVCFMGLGFMYGKCKNQVTPQDNVNPSPIEERQFGKIENIGDNTIQCPPAPQAPECPSIPACPPQVVPNCPAPRVVDRPVYIERPMPYGCYVNWHTGEVTARSRPGMNIECYVNRASRNVDTIEYKPGMLRRGPPQGGVLDQAGKWYEEQKQIINH